MQCWLILSRWYINWIKGHNMSESAVTLGRIQTEFNCLYGTKEMLKRLTLADRTKELSRICAREGVSFKGFSYLERALLGGV